MTATNYTYNYDPIGNRTNSVSNGVGTTYARNSLNQYTNITGAGARVMKYDLDGNLTNSGVFAYTWDAENRLVSVSSNGTVLASYKYDYMSRRYQKAAGTTTNTFLYDGWNVISEVSRQSSVVSTNAYTWGMDLSGSLQGAGGIGGLLAARISGTNVLYCYDANGNVTDLVGTNRAVLATYKYDPYGNLISKSGEMADANRFRFSTKYTDNETGLLYYG